MLHMYCNYMYALQISRSVAAWKPKIWVTMLLFACYKARCLTANIGLGHSRIIMYTVAPVCHRKGPYPITYPNPKNRTFGMAGRPCTLLLLIVQTACCYVLDHRATERWRMK